MCKIACLILVSAFCFALYEHVSCARNSTTSVPLFYLITRMLLYSFFLFASLFSVVLSRHYKCSISTYLETLMDLNPL